MSDYKTPPLDIQLAIEELSLSGEVSLGRCSRSTAYRDVKRVNEFLHNNHYDWRVKLTVDKASAFPYGLKVI